MLVLQILRHVAAHDALCQTFHDGGLTGTRFTDEDRVVLRAAREDLQYTTDFIVAADDGVELSLAGIVDEVLGILRERLVVLVTAHRLHLLSLSQFGDGLLQAFLGNAGILHDAASGRVDLQECQQHGFTRNELVARLLGSVHSALQHLTGRVREIGLAALYAWQMRDLAFHQAFHLLAVHAQLAKEEVGDVLGLLHDAVEQVDRLDGLLTCRLRTSCCSLYGFLRFDCKLVECHNYTPFLLFVYSIPLPANVKPNRRICQNVRKRPTICHYLVKRN